MPFVKGQSGNPKGRPKGLSANARVLLEVKALCRNHSVEAIGALVEVMNSPSAPPPARVAAANSILDRAFGRPTTMVEAKVSTYDNMTEQELIEFIVGQTIEGDAVRLLENDSETNDDGAEE